MEDMLGILFAAFVRLIDPRIQACLGILPWSKFAVKGAQFGFLGGINSAGCSFNLEFAMRRAGN